MSNTYQIGNGNPVVMPDNPTETESRGCIEKARRNACLASSDWAIVEDNGLSASKKTKWKTYRQALRDLDTSDYKNITWPTKPE